MYHQPTSIESMSAGKSKVVNKSTPRRTSRTFSMSRTAFNGLGTLSPTAASLRGLGLAQPERAARAARTCPERRRLAQACAAPALRFMARSGLSRGRGGGHKAIARRGQS